MTLRRHAMPEGHRKSSMFSYAKTMLVSGTDSGCAKCDPASISRGSRLPQLPRGGPPGPAGSDAGIRSGAERPRAGVQQPTDAPRGRIPRTRRKASPPTTRE